ncbi:MAG: glycoside hydrolase family 43 protein [Bacteroidota bacterium]
MQHVTTFISYIILVLIFPLTESAQRNDGAAIAGDFADPSIIKVGKTYYAVATSSEWAPHFPIFKSTDLKNWHQAGYVFDKTPEWTSGSFWAPEYYKIKDTYYIYYTARRKTDNTSYIGVATSKYPDKGFTDHGLLITFGKEAIDAFVFNDNGHLYITFKAYGLDKRPIEILASKLSADGLKLEGEPFSLLKDEQRIGMEGESILKRNGYYYIFYSAGNCCGVQCSYNVRVARSKSFKGPYEVYANNPILSENDKWKCMGHGTFVKGNNGADLYLHHAYNKESMAFTGRQGLISELVWSKNNEWPSFKTQEIAGGAVADIHDSFTTTTVAKYWQWDFRNSSPIIKQQKGVLNLSGSVKQGNETGIVLTARPVSGSFTMTTTVLNNNAALKGLSFYGDANIAFGIGTQNDRIVLWQVKGNKFSTIAQETTPGKLPVQLKFEVNEDRICQFYFKQGNEGWKELKTETPVKANNLPQWDRSPRAGLHFKGDANQDAQFSDFSIVNQ